MKTITVKKHDAQGQFVWAYEGELIGRTAVSLTINAIFQREDMDLGFAIFKKGDRFIEHFYADRWYNIFALYDRDNGHHKGWYCNICRPAQLLNNAVVYDDLALDLWVNADGTYQVLDEDEFAQLTIPQTDAQQAQEALNALITMAQLETLPT